MEAFLDCVSCSGFVPHEAAACPHCGKSVPRKKEARPAARIGLLGAVATAAAGGLMSITLMACYGVAYTCDGDDADGDGYRTNCDLESDCNDDDPNVYPGAEDPEGDGIDQNCDGQDGTGGGGGAGGAGGSTGGGGAGGATGTTGT